MKTRIFALILIILVSTTSCARNTTLNVTATSSAITPTIVASSTSLPSSTPTAQPTVRQTKIEVVTDNAVTGNGGNAWGGHQTRIVHTQDGIFTAYTVAGDGQFSRDWRLAERQSDGTWSVIASGKAGQQPVNLLASPDGTLHVIGWPSGTATMWSGKPNSGTISMTAERIPHLTAGNYPYSSSSADANGDLCVVSSDGFGAPGILDFACYVPQKGAWVTQTKKLDYRYNYSYVFPEPNGQLSVVATRDVLWSALGYKQPPGTFDYVFNAFRYWRTEDISNKPLEQVYFLEEKPTTQYPNVILNAQEDAYLDTKGNMHVIYHIEGASTGDDFLSRQVIISPEGKVLFDVPLPKAAGDYSRIFQDQRGQFYLLGSAGFLYLMDQDGVHASNPFRLDLGGYNVEYSGFGLSVPRTGSPLSNIIDVVFPSSNGSAWLYFQLDLSQFVSATQVISPTQTPNVSNLNSTSNTMTKMLASAQILFNANMNDVTLTGWQGQSSGIPPTATQNGTLIFTPNSPQIHSDYALKENEACLMLFRYGGDDPGFQFTAISGNWPDTWKNWGINEGTDDTMPAKHFQFNYTIGENNGTYESLGLRDAANLWYYVMLWVEGNTTFHIAVWEKDNPTVFAEHQLQFTDTTSWGNRRWQCNLLVTGGTIEMGSYQEVRLTQSP